MSPSGLLHGSSVVETHSFQNLKHKTKQNKTSALAVLQTQWETSPQTAASCAWVHPSRSQFIGDSAMILVFNRLNGSDLAMQSFGSKLTLITCI